MSKQLARFNFKRSHSQKSCRRYIFRISNTTPKNKCQYIQHSK